MLGKLMKYELKATARWFLPLYAAILIFAVINGFFFSHPMVDGGMISLKEIFSALSMFLYSILFVGIMAVTLVVMIQRFYKSLLGDEGYLMFTLPVVTWKHIINKLGIAMVWSILSGLIAFGSIIIMIPSKDFSAFSQAMKAFIDVFGTSGAITLPLLILISIAYGVAEIYAAIALGHLFNKHKLLASFGMYLVLNTVTKFAYLLTIPVLSNMFPDLAQSIYVQIPPAQLNTLFVVLLLITSVLTAVLLILTNVILKKKLNLE